MYQRRTSVMPSGSVALTVTLMVPETMEPLAGEVMEIVGFEPLLTVTLIVAEARLPAASKATAIKKWVPLGSPSVFQLKE